MEGFYWQDTYWPKEKEYWPDFYWHIKSAVIGFVTFSILRVRATVNANLRVV